MNVFDLRKRLVDDYASYTASFINIADTRILAKVQSELDGGAFWPEPMLQTRKMASSERRRWPAKYFARLISSLP